MKKTTLTFLLLISAFFSLADGGCTYAIRKTSFEDSEGKKVRLTFYVPQQNAICTGLENCTSFEWYRHNGSGFDLIPGENNEFYDVCEPGVYKLVACGISPWIGCKIDSNEVHKNVILPEKAINKFSAYPNPCSDGKINLLVPDSPVSSETDKFKVEIYNVLGNQVFIKENLEFGTKNLPIDLSNQGKGIFILKISSGTEVKVLKVLVN